jgi:serine/threonine protein kinase
MLYEAMTNRLPFYHDNPTEVAKMQINKEPTPPSVYRTDISVGLEQIILRAMEKNPKKRYTNAMEMLTDIRALRQNSKTVFGNEKNFSRYRVIERKPHSNASNVSNRSIYPMSERGANFVDNQTYFKRNTSHSGTFKPSSQQFSSQTGRATAQNSKTIAITSSNPAAARTQRLPSGTIPPMHSQKLPPASNTVAIEDKQINKDLKENKWIKILFGVICALMIIIVISCIIWFYLNKNDNTSPLTNQSYNTETEIEWNTEHTEKF